jgi:hypothetical protein
LSPPQHDLDCVKVQESVRANPACGGPHRRRPRRRPRRRRCLLKGCEQPFQPTHPQARYCSEACRHAARRWRAWRARQRYRATEQGKACRRRQSCRYRERVRRRREQEGPVTQEPVPAGREGQRPARLLKKSSCDRPGCYTCFDVPSRSPLKRFCSSLCRRALQRVLEREARWRRWSLRRKPKCRSG